MKHHYPDCQGGPDCNCDERESGEGDALPDVCCPRLEPIHKFNGGRGATLCHSCRTIINEGFSGALFCDFCANDIAQPPADEKR